MTFLATTFPLQAAEPVIQTIVSAVRPVLGMGLFLIMGAFAALLTLFRPLVFGVMRAALLVIRPRLSLEDRRARGTLRGVQMLNRMANEFDASQPNLASELRNLASRG